MKIVGIGTELKKGKVLEITREGVVVDCNGERVVLTFSQVESEVFGG